MTDRPMTARQIIERRVGYRLPVLREMAPDQRNAVKRLAIYLVLARAKEVQP